jgi:hypothetical protein
LNLLRADTTAHQAWWLAHPTPPQPVAGGAGIAAAPGMRRQYSPTGAGAWGAAHPVAAGLGAETYASILEIVTPAYAPETAAGRLNIVAAMTEANNLAAAIEAGTNNFANRILLNTIGGTAGLQANTYVGNANQPAQTTDASIQGTMGIDLAQIASFFKSTIAAANRPQQLFTLKHQSDPAGAMGMPAPRRAETEMARAPLAAKRVIRNRLAAAPGWGGNVTHMRGLITLICQYLMMGKYSLYGGAWGLDKNIVPLLSRNDLGAVIFNELVPPGERALVAGGLGAFVRNAILAETVRNGATPVFNDAAESIPLGAPPLNVSCQQFVDNVLSGVPDGITGQLGGFRTFAHGEDVDPTAARGGDYRRGGVAHREGAIFELRNIVPSDALNLPTDRLPRNQWVNLATHLATVLDALNARTVAASATDTRYNQAAGALQNEPAPW